VCDCGLFFLLGCFGVLVVVGGGGGGGGVTGAFCLKGIMPKLVVSCINLLSPICCRRCTALLGNLTLTMF